MDEQTDMTKPVVAFCNFANVPNKLIRLELLKQWATAQLINLLKPTGYLMHQLV
jgi:hypothetical protein